MGSGNTMVLFFSTAISHYNEHYFEAWEIRDIDQLLNKLYITTFALIDTILTSIGFEGICTL